MLRSQRLVPAAALLGVLVLKSLVVLQLKDHLLLQEDAGLDTTAYLQLARRVTAGDLWLGPDLYFVSPLYIYFCAAVLAVVDSLAAIRVLEVGLGTATVAFTFVAARAWFGSTAAWISAAFATLTGLLTFYEVLIIQAALDPFLTASALAALALALTRDSARHAFISGIALGLLAMNRPNALAAGGGLLLIVAARHRQLAGWLLMGLALSLAPLVVRNGVVVGQWGTLTSHGGLNFYIGNHAAADGSYKAIEGITPNMAGQQEDARRVVSAALGRSVTDAEASSYFVRQALAWIGEHPGAAFRLWLRKLHLLFSAEHLWLNYSYPFFAYDANTLLRLLFIGPAVLIPLGGVGLLLGRPQQRAEYLMWLSFLPLYALSVSAFFVSERYRLPILVPLLVGSGALIARAVESVRSRDTMRAARLTLPVVAVSLTANWPLGMDDGRAEQRLRMAEALARRGHADTARQWTEKAVESGHVPALVHFRIGRAFAAGGQTADAVRHLEEAERLDPGGPEVSFALGQALLDAGRAGDAVSHLRVALAAGVRPDLSGYDLARALAATGEKGEALRVVEQVRPAGPGDPWSWYALGQLAENLGSPVTAAAKYRQAVILAPEWPQARERYGLMLTLSNDFEAAAEQLEAAVRLVPNAPASHLNLAVVYARLGRIEEARVHAREAARLDPDYQKAKDLLKALEK